MGIVDCGKYNIKVKFNTTTLIDSSVNINEKDDFDIWLQNPYYCEVEYWSSSSFIVLDSNHQNSGLLEIFVNGTCKISYPVVNGGFPEIADCSNRSRYVSPSDLLSGYGTFHIWINFTENGVTKTLRDESVVVGEFEPTVGPKLEVYLDFYTVNLHADNVAHINLPREARGNLTVSYNNVNNEVITYSKAYGEYYIHAWDLNHLGVNTLTFKYVGDDFGTLTASVDCVVVPNIMAPSFVSAGEEFKISMTTHNWVNGDFSVYDYNNDKKGNLLVSGRITNGVFAVSLSSDIVGLNKYYLEFDYPGGDFPLIREVYVVENSENITFSVPAVWVLVQVLLSTLLLRPILSALHISLLMV